MRNQTTSAALALLVSALAACETSKSANPLSPSVAGPIPGVNITAPTPLQPEAGSEVDAREQPLTLLLENASSNGVRPLTYSFEVSLDPEFGNKILTREGVDPGDGRTALRLSDALAADRTYYWRARARDGANTGPYSNAAAFTVFTPIVLEQPGLVSPAANAQLPNRTPSFVISNARRSGPVGKVTYTLHIARDQAFGSMVAHLELPENLPNTSKTLDGELEGGATYFWRVRAWEASRGTIGPWSATYAFKTAAAPVFVDPTPPPSSSGGSGPLPAPPYTTDGDELVARVAAAYPSYLAARVSLSQRKSNMAFLRDKIIEQGLCGGMQLGWNWKRGKVGDLSYDYITYYKGGRWIGVDVGAAYDDTSRPLRLVWNENPDDRYATYGGYSPAPSCR